MKLVLLALAIIGYCFDINSGCCCKRNNDGNGGGFGNLKSKKSVPGGGGGSGNLGTKKGEPTGGGHKPTKGKGVVRNGDIQKIKVSNDGVSIIFSDKNIQLGESDLLDGDGCEGLVNIWFNIENKIGKGNDIAIYKIPVTEISLPNGIPVEIDNSIKSSPYLIAIGLYDDENYFFMVCVGENLSELFSGSNRLKRLFIFGSEHIDNMEDMFNGCTSLELLDLRNFDTSDVTKMCRMFNHCESLESLDMSNFNTSNVENMMYMFNGCKSLNHLKLGDNFKSDKVTTVESMFSMCNNLVELDFNKFDINKFTQANKRRNLISNCNSLIKIVCCNMLDNALVKHFSDECFTTVDKKTFVKNTK